MSIVIIGGIIVAVIGMLVSAELMYIKADRLKAQMDQQNKTTPDE